MNLQRLSAALLFAMLLLSRADAAPVLWSTASGGNGHYYELVSGSTPITWADALAAADTASFSQASFTFDGYLVTITSAAEQAFIDTTFFGVSRQLYWLAGTDEAVDGEWRWAAGPEVGTLFWLGGATGSAPAGVYSNWAQGEPSNQNGVEDYAVGNWTTAGAWNDAFGGTRNPAYIIEYQAVPEPAGLLTLAFGLAAVWRRGWNRPRS